jgi:AraC-like DNA-binding protein
MIHRDVKPGNVLVTPEGEAKLSDLGLAGRVALCAATAGGALRSLEEHLNLHDSAATVTLIENEPYPRFVYAIAGHGLTDTRQFQLGGATIACNLLQDLFGKDWVPTVVRFASRTPSNLRPFQKIFRAPLEFNSEESAIVFPRHWLERPLPPTDPSVQASVAAAVGLQRAEIMADLPGTLRRILRRRLVLDAFSMDEVATQLSMHRRTLDRRLQRHGTTYGELLESVREDVARQLLRETQMPIQRVAESVRFSSAANFATAFRRRAGMTPTEYRRHAS